MDGIEVCKKLMDQNKDLRILTISSFKESGLVKSMIQAGASGYLLKNADKSVLIEAIRSVHGGEQFIQKELNEQLVAEALNKPVQSSYIPRLTRREKEVLQLIIDEFTTQEIADKLSISPKTVETHRLNLLLKLEAKNTAGLVKIALQKNLV
jgi:DNA-binding NarL/FixJ family response regulator